MHGHCRHCAPVRRRPRPRPAVGAGGPRHLRAPPPRRPSAAAAPAPAAAAAADDDVLTELPPAPPRRASRRGRRSCGGARPDDARERGPAHAEVGRREARVPRDPHRRRRRRAAPPVRGRREDVPQRDAAAARRRIGHDRRRRAERQRDGNVYRWDPAERRDVRRRRRPAAEHVPAFLGRRPWPRPRGIHTRTGRCPTPSAVPTLPISVPATRARPATRGRCGRASRLSAGARHRV